MDAAIAAVLDTYHEMISIERGQPLTTTGSKGIHCLEASDDCAFLGALFKLPRRARVPVYHQR